MKTISNLENNPFQILGKSSGKLSYEDYSITSTYITMRDGVKIAATICVPKELPSGEKVPTVLSQTRYMRAHTLNIPFRWIFNEVVYGLPKTEVLSSHGYAVVYVDVRGTGASFGTRPYPFSDNEIKDGADIVDWIVAQPWSNGNVVSNGISYSGSTAELLATNNHPAVKAVMPGHAFFDPYADVLFPGGCFCTMFVQLWSILGQLLDRNDVSMFKQIMPAFWLLLKSVTPVDKDIDLSILKKAIKEHHSNQYIYDLTKKYSFRDDSLPDGTTPDQFSIFSHKSQVEKLNIPVLAWCSWLDSGYVDALINRFLNIENPMIAIMGDWNHGARTPANQFFSSRTQVSPTPKERITAWVGFFNKCLKGDGIKGKTLYYYTMVEEKWKKTNVWPPAGQSMQRWFLKENNGLSASISKGKSGEDNYKINFRTTTGTFNRWYTLLSFPISYPNRDKEDKKLLTYTSAPVKENIEITGNPIINLYIASTYEDGAIFAYLEDVDENGNVTYITDGQFRVIHRKISSEKPPYKMMIPYHSFLSKDAMPLVPGEIAEIKFGLYATSVIIRKGHSIRIAIAGADKDTFLRYPAKGKPTITIARNKTHPSYIDLPVIRKV